MNKTTVGKSIIAGIIVHFPLITFAFEKESNKPNIILLLTDDHRWNSVGFMGNNIIQTPNLDSLAKNGTVFDNAYVTSSISCSSRASILTGQYTSRHGINSFDKSFTDKQLEFTYPIMLKKAGYKIGFIGKYGVGLSHPKSYFDFWTCNPNHQPDYSNKDSSGKYLHHTDLVNNEIDDFLNKYSNESPFCLSVSFKAPHCQDGDPEQFLYHPRYTDLYTKITIPNTESTDDKFWNSYPDCFKRNNEGRERWKLRFDEPEKYQKMIKAYYRLITHVDEVVGNLVEYLKRKGLDKNTIIIFMGDNGFLFGEHGLAGKWYAYDESIRIPLLIYDPRDMKSRRINKMALNIDIAPTILKYAGLKTPKTMQGAYLQSIMHNPKIKWRKDFFYEQTVNIPTISKCEAYVSENYKYVQYFECIPAFEELFNRKSDPNEQTNLAKDIEFNRLKLKLKQNLQKLKQKAK